MPRIERWILARARAPVGEWRFPFGRRHHGDEGLLMSLELDGWRPGELLQKPSPIELRVGVLLIAFVVAFLLGRLVAHSGGPWPLLAGGAYVAGFFFCLFVSIACGPVVLFRVDGLEVWSRSEGSHFVPWQDIHSWDHLPLGPARYCFIDLGPRSPLASRRIMLARLRRRSLRAS